MKRKIFLLILCSAMIASCGDDGRQVAKTTLPKSQDPNDPIVIADQITAQYKENRDEAVNYQPAELPKQNYDFSAADEIASQYTNKESAPVITQQDQSPQVQSPQIPGNSAAQNGTLATANTDNQSHGGKIGNQTQAQGEDRIKVLNEYHVDRDPWGSKHAIVFQNISSSPLDADCNATLLDVNGNAIAVANAEICGIAPQQTKCLYLYFDKTGGDAVDYTISYMDSSYTPVQNIDLKSSYTNDSALITVTNNENFPAQFFEPCVLFFSGNNLVDIGETYITDMNYEIKPNTTLSGQVNCFDPFDSIEVYWDARYANW